LDMDGSWMDGEANTPFLLSSSVTNVGCFACTMIVGFVSFYRAGLAMSDYLSVLW
jgi:hypothetical protein